MRGKNCSIYRKALRAAMLAALVVGMLSGCAGLGGRNAHRCAFRICADTPMDADDVAAVGNVLGVSYAEGLCRRQTKAEIKGTVTEVTVQSLPVQIQKLELVQGRMPLSSYEAVVDANVFRQLGMALGCRIALDEKLVYNDDVTLVGVVNNLWGDASDWGVYLMMENLRSSGFDEICVFAEDGSKALAAVEQIRTQRQQRSYDRLYDSLNTKADQLEQLIQVAQILENGGEVQQDIPQEYRKMIRDFAARYGRYDRPIAQLRQEKAAFEQQRDSLKMPVWTMKEEGV